MHTYKVLDVGWRITALTAMCMAVLAMDPASASAESCLHQVLRLAQRHGLSTDPPTVPRQGPPDVTTRELGRSGGVLEPRSVQDEALISPPADGDYGMPTVPEVTPRQELTANLATLQAILVAARAEAERGNEAGCREGLSRAKKVLERAG